MDTVQTNVRVAAEDKPLIVAVAARLRRDPAFRAQLRALLADQATATTEDRIKKLEQQVSGLLSSASAASPAAGRPQHQPFPKVPPAQASLRALRQED